MSRKPEKAKAFFFIVPPFNMVAPPTPVAETILHRPPTPPANRGDWTVEVPGIGPSGSSVWARPAVLVDFIGTINVEKPDPRLSEAQKLKRQKAIDEEAELNRDCLQQAVFILSQSPTGRDVLEQMTKEGYRIVFDDRRTGDRGAGGLCDPSEKLIILKGHDNPEYLALLLGHESVHAVQNTRHDLFPSTRHKPEVGIKMSFAIEADAYAQQSQIALELAYGDPQGPADQLKMRGPLLQMRDRFPDIIKAAEKVLINDKALQNGATVAAAFEAFYDNFYLRTFYEDAHIDWANQYAPRLKGSFPWLQRHFSKDTDSQWIKDRIQHRGKSYLNDHLPHMTFDDARHSGLTEVTGKKVQKFYKNHMKDEPPALKTFGVHMRDAADVLYGLVSGIHAIVKPGAAPPKAANSKKPTFNG